MIEEIAGSAVQIQTVQDSNEVIFKTSSLDVEQREALNEMFVDKFGVDEKLITSETISSVISSEMKTDTVIAVVVAIIFMLLYIRIRFKDLRFGLSGTNFCRNTYHRLPARQMEEYAPQTMPTIKGSAKSRMLVTRWWWPSYSCCSTSASGSRTSGSA